MRKNKSRSKNYPCRGVYVYLKNEKSVFLRKVNVSLEIRVYSATTDRCFLLARVHQTLRYDCWDITISTEANGARPNRRNGIVEFFCPFFNYSNFDLI